MEGKKFNISYILIGIILAGSVWGVLEASLGLLLTNFLLRGAIMLSIGAFIVSTFLRVYRPRKIFASILLIGIIASLLKGIDFFIVGPQKMVTSPMIAIIVEAVALGAIISLAQKAYYTNKFVQPLTGILYAYASYIGFVFFFYFLKLGTNYWLKKSIYEVFNLILLDGTKAAILCVVAVLAGNKVGELLKTPQLNLIKMRLFYPASFTVILVCWTIGLMVAL